MTRPSRATVSGRAYLDLLPVPAQADAWGLEAQRMIVLDAATILAPKLNRRAKGQC